MVRVTITLPEQFPYQPPVVQCLPPVPTPHMDSSGYLRPSAHEGLQRWNAQNNLGKIVYELIAGVIAPATPKVSEVTSPPPLYHQSSEPGQFSTGRTSTPSFSRKSKAAEIQVPISFPEVERRPVSELQVCLADEGQFYLFLEDVEAYRELNRLCDSSRDSNVEQAEKNLLRKPEIDNLQRELQSSAMELTALKRLYDEKASLQKSKMQKFSPQVLLSKLATATREVDVQSENMSREYEGKIPIRDFLASYIELRKTYHSRNAKLETMQANN